VWRVCVVRPEIKQLRTKEKTNNKTRNKTTQ